MLKDELIRRYGVLAQVGDFEGRSWRPGGVLVVGQDAGITTGAKVHEVLMLDDERSALARFVAESLLRPLDLTLEEVAAVNLIETRFRISLYNIAADLGWPLARLVVELSKESWSTLEGKIKKHQPERILTMGRPTFEAVVQALGIEARWDKSIVGRPIPVNIARRKIDWIPCIHLHTWIRWQRYYGEVLPARLMAAARAS